MKVTKDMIHPDIRFAGSVVRVIWPKFTNRKFRFVNKTLGIFAKGHGFTRKLSYREEYIDREGGKKLRTCIYTPKTKQPGKLPGLLWLHGGGYAAGMPEQDFPLIKMFVAASPAVVAAPDYTRSVDAPYPAALDDCYAALVWMKQNSERLGIDDSRLFVGGTSAGGGLTAAVCLYARDRGEVNVAFQMPLYPMLDDRDSTESVTDNNAPVWNQASNRLAWEIYLGGQKAEKYAAPARETDYSNLPPALTFVGGIDPFRDETITFVENLKKAGVAVDFKLFEGCFHAFDLLTFAKVAKQANEFACKGFEYAAKHYTAPQTSGQ